MAVRMWDLGNVLARVEQIKNARYARDPSNPQNQLNQLRIQQAERELDSPDTQYINVPPGGTLFDPNTGKPAFQAPFKTAEPKQDPNVSGYRQAVDAGYIDPNKVDYPTYLGLLRAPLVDMSTGGGNTQPTPQKTAQAQELGVPLLSDAPWAHIRDPKEQDKARVMFLREATTRGQDLTKSAVTAAQMNTDIDRFLKLNETNYTGGWMGVPFAKPGRKLLDAEFGEMMSLADKMTPGMRQGLPGAASDRDIAMFANATVGPEQLPEANKNIGLGLKVANQNKIDAKKFHAAFLKANGHDIGWDTEWLSYLDANPIFDPEADAGSYQLNQNRQTWREYFYPDGEGKKAKPTRAGAATETPKQPEITEGTIIFNPNTNERLIRRGDTWQPIQ